MLLDLCPTQTNSKPRLGLTQGLGNIMEYLSITETNKLIRKVLKESFPGVKFSVRGRSYSMGGSTNIGWTDGPNDKQVEALISVFEGSYFDGMIDYKGSRYGALDGQEVSFGPDFIFTNRRHSDTLRDKITARLIDKHGLPDGYDSIQSLLMGFDQGMLHSISPYLNNDNTCMNPYTWQALIGRGCAKHTLNPFPEHSPTFDRVAFKGDDGYGAGCVGRDGKGEGYGGYPRVGGQPI